MATDLGAVSRSRPSGQAPAGLDASRIDRGEGLRCHGCGKFLNPLANSRFHFIPLNEFGPEEAWWECYPNCKQRSAA